MPAVSSTRHGSPSRSATPTKSSIQCYEGTGDNDTADLARPWTRRLEDPRGSPPKSPTPSSSPVTPSSRGRKRQHRDDLRRPRGQRPGVRPGTAPIAPRRTSAMAPEPGATATSNQHPERLGTNLQPRSRRKTNKNARGPRRTRTASASRRRAKKSKRAGGTRMMTVGEALLAALFSGAVLGAAAPPR